jgi:hypothetical protein
MVKKVATIDIVEIDTETVVRTHYLSRDYAFFIRLSGEPEPQWIKIFNFESSRSRYLTKKKISVVGDKLLLYCGADDNIENQVAFARDLVKKTNLRIEEDNRRIDILYRKKLGDREEREEDKEEIRRKLKEIS